MITTLTRWRRYLPTQARLLQLLPMLVIALFGFIFALLIVVAVMPAVQARSERLAQLPGANQALQVAQAAQAAAPQQVQVQVDQAKIRLQKAAAYFLSEAQAADALNRLYQAARASGVTIVALENQTAEDQTTLPAIDAAPTATTPYTTRTVGLRATGEMGQLINFVARIRESKRSGFVITNLRIGLASTQAAAATGANARTTTKNSTTTGGPPTSGLNTAPLQTATMNINLYTSEYAQGGATAVTGTLTTTVATPAATPVVTVPISAPVGSELLFPLPTFTPSAPLAPTAVVLLPLATPIPTLPGLPTIIPLPTPTLMPTLPPTASATPIALPSPTATGLPTTPPTATPLPTVTSTVPPTPTSSPTPLPAGCSNLLLNSDFEGVGGWSPGENALLPQLTTNQAYNGVHAMQLGNPPGAYNGQIASYSSIQQTVTIPASASNAILRWWHWDGSEEPPYGTPSSEADRQDVVLLSPNGDVLALLQRVRRNEGTWLPSAIDLSAFRGQSIVLYFNVYNDGLGGRTWSYLDEVRLETCTGGTATSVPTNTPVVSPLPTATAAVFVKSSRSFTQSGSLYVVGEVVNGSAQSIYSTQIQAKFFDQANQLIAVEDAYALLDMTLPGQNNPFRIILSNPPDTITHYELAPVYQNSALLNYRPLTVLSQQVRNNSGIEVYGEIQNDNENVVPFYNIVVTFYDSGGIVINVDYDIAPISLAPGEDATYQISTFNDFAYSSFIAQAQSYIMP